MVSFLHFHVLGTVTLLRNACVVWKTGINPGVCISLDHFINLLAQIYHLDVTMSQYFWAERSLL